MPKTKLGRISLTLIAAFFLLSFTGGFIVSVLGQSGGETFFDNLYISIPMLSAIFCAVLSFFTGIIAILKYKERSPFIFISSLIGLLIGIFILGEILSPH